MPRLELQLPAPVDLLGIPIHPIAPDELVGTLVAWGEGAAQRKVHYVNVHAMNVAERDLSFRSALRRADLVFCDGFGVKWGARLAGVHIPHRMTPPDWVDDFAAAAADARQPIFALGDEPGIAGSFLRVLQARHPRLVTAGSHHGFFLKSGTENDAVIDTINASGAGHLLVGFGMPLQERWIEENAHRLAPRVLISVGALFRWHTGAERRAPRWVTDRGLEWLIRFTRHPVRHFRRYAIGNPQFLLRVLVRGRRPGRSP
jgi:N-acetylglucosaminyldiphosphoundecaprenol N-acetyl-beta-D-mannosaminyltransferase